MIGKQVLTGLVAAGLLGLAGTSTRAATFDASELSFCNAVVSQFDLVNLDRSMAETLPVSGGKPAGRSSYGAAAVFDSLNDAPPVAAMALASPPGTIQASFAATIEHGASGQPLASAMLASVFPYGSLGSRLRLQRGIAPLPGTPGLTAVDLPASGFTSYGPVRTARTSVAAMGGVADGDLPTLDAPEGKVSRDFVDAGPLATGGPSGITALAPLATIAQHSALDGPVIVAVMSQSAELHHGDVFTGL